MPTIEDNTAQLLYRVGPVLCCSPCLAIRSIIEPPNLTHPPGTSRARPGIFRYANVIVSSLDLRYKFGVEEADWTRPGRTIVTQLDKVHVGFYVDEILDVISMPASGWGSLPALLPRGIFTRTLLLKQHIHLYADFHDLLRIPDSGYLRHYIRQLLEAEQQHKPTSITTKVITATRASNLSSQQHTQPQQSVTAHVVTTPLPTTRRVTTSTVAIHTAQSHNHTATDIASAKSSLATQKKSRPPPRPVHVDAALRSVPTPENKISNSDQTNRATKLTAQQNAASPTGSTSTVGRQATPVSITRSNNPTTPVRQPTNIHRSQQEPSTGTSHSLIGIFMLLLLFSGLGSGLWYVLRDDTTHVSQQTASPSLTIAQAPESRATVASKPADNIGTPRAANSPVTEFKPSQSDTASVHVSAATPATPAQTLTDVVPSPTGTPATTASEYHASIEQDQHGLTITLDVPADDPAFTQAPPAIVPTDQTKAVVAAGPETVSKKTTTATATTPASEGSVTSGPSQHTAPTPHTVEIVHIVVQGDTLWDIAKRYVNNPFRYPELARLSKIRNPDLIYPGNRVRIIKRQRQP